MAEEKTNSSSEVEENQNRPFKASEKKLEIIKTHLLAPTTGLEDYGFQGTEILK